MGSQEIFERYIYAGMTRNAEMLADLFAPDGVYEAPLEPPDGAFPRRLVGRDEIRAGMATYYQRPADTRTVDLAKTGYVLHTTADPDVFIAEIDAGFEDGSGMALVQIFRVRDGKITLLRDYFAAL
ncbi:nuclear transport factor 2 family protein [Actinomycetes bacterium KLBMP 9797]